MLSLSKHLKNIEDMNILRQAQDDYFGDFFDSP